MKKIILGIAAALLLVVPVFAAGNSAPKATGSYDYIYGIQRHAQFNAIATSVGCDYTWDVSGNWVLDFAGGTANREFRNLVQDTEGNVVGEFWYYSGTWLYGGTLVGSVEGDTLTLHYDRSPAYTYTGDFVGTIGDGVITAGVFDDSNGNHLFWTATGPSVKDYGNSCTGKGSFNYSDENGTYYGVDVKYVSVLENTAWFAGPVVSGNMGGFGQWLFVKVVDIGEPGIGADTSTGDFPLTEAQAKYNVASHADPVIPDIVINGGNIQVH